MERMDNREMEKRSWGREGHVTGKAERVEGKYKRKRGTSGELKGKGGSGEKGNRERRE